jgi:hypothetical protein
MPRGKKFTAEQIIGKLREAEVGLGEEKGLPEVVRKLGVTAQTCYRWKRENGGLRTDQAKRLKDLEKENARLNRLFADAELWTRRSFGRRPRAAEGVRSPTSEPGEAASGSRACA